MKIQHKFAFYMFFIVVLFLVTLSLLFYWYNRQSAIDASLGLMKITVQEESKYLSDRLIEKSKIAISIASSNTLTNAIEKSNKEFSAMVEQDRKSRIKTLNDRWITTTNINTPFIKSYMTNEVASALKLQQNALPGEIGEIFVTNRYGVIVGTTNKLSTLAHSHKYWWQATYDNGKGKIFFDDRGYDESVGGYVIGIVIPIKKNNEIIGILKCNFNLLPTLSYYLDSLDRNSEQTDQWPRHVKLVRSSGRIVLTKGATPLSTTL
ncbi:MAG: hypothetical protein OEZ38_11420, partial [Gammaproteobacteria bacterium]|nr:hypothetical protein [Gammaproteobacteria bacterium]